MWRLWQPHQLTGGLEPIHHRHSNVHEHHVGSAAPAGLDRLGPVVGLGHNAQLGVGLEDHAESGSHQGLVVGDDHADGHASTPAPVGRCTYTVSAPAAVSTRREPS